MVQSVRQRFYQSHPTEPNFLTQRVNTYYQERVRDTWNGRHLLKGRKPSQTSVVITSNDYLSIANHPDVIKAQIDTLKQTGNGLAMSAVFFHDDNPQAQLEAQFAQFLQAEDVVITQSGWCANVGLIQSIANKDVPVYIDLSAHMSLWEGAQSAGAKAVPFCHNNVYSLERMLKKHGPGIVAVDSIYSTTGDICPLVDFAHIAEQYGCIFIVDESHSLGTHGENGAGLVVALDLTDKVHFRTASLAKACAGRGGLIAGSARHTEFFRYESRPSIFSSAILPHDVAGFTAILNVISQEQWRRTRLHRNADYLRNALIDMGYNTNNSQSQIISLIAGPEQKTMMLRDALEELDVFGSVFCAPATPKNSSLVRFSVTTDLSQVQLDKIIDACYKIRDRVDMKNWASTRLITKL